MHEKGVPRNFLQKVMRIGLIHWVLTVVCAGVAVAHEGRTQNPLDRRVTIRLQNQEVAGVLQKLGKAAEVRFMYSPELIQASRRISVEARQERLAEVLDRLLPPLKISYEVSGSQILLKRSPSSNVSQTNDQAQATTTPLPVALAAATVTGRVIDENGVGLPGVNVLLQGTQQGAATNADGRYSLTVPDRNDGPAGGVLVFSSVGYERQEVPIQNRSTVDVTLKAAVGSLNEVVVVGYGIQKKTDLTGAISTVTGAEISRLPVAGIDQALQGRAAGVRVTQSTGAPGEGVAVRIRGVGTINDNSPLFIIDGVPTKDAINVLSPTDIESISVLKDASSSAIYGARAANGVILVTTKKGRSGAPRVNFSAYGGVQQHGKLIKMVNTPQYVQLYNEAVDNDNQGVENPQLFRRKIPDGLQLANTDWQREIFQTGPIQNYQLSVSGGGDRSHYLLSGTYFNQKGIVLNSGYERYTLKANVDTDISRKLKAGTNLNLAFSDRAIIGSSGDGYGGNGGSVIRYALFRTPAIAVYDQTGQFTDLPASPNFFGDGYNPVGLALKADNHEKQYRIFGNLYAEYQILEALKFRTDGGLDFNVINRKIYNENWGTNLRINSPATLVNRVALGSALNWNNTLTYARTFNQKHNVSVLLGTEAIKNVNRLIGGTDRNFLDQVDNLRYLGRGVGVGNQTSFEGDSRWALFSLFGRANYSYADTYLFSANIRRDGSSRFAPQYRYGTFYSGSLGWNLDREAFMEPLLGTISTLKLRASIGQLGNQDIGNYPFASIVSSGYNYPFGTDLQSTPGYTITSRGNSQVKWESSTQADIGLDFGFFNNKLLLTLDYFNKRTSDMLIPIPVPRSGGSAGAPYVNAGKVENQGLEFDLSYRKRSGAWTYDLTANGAFIQNKVLSLSDGRPIPGGRIDNGVFATLTEPGHPIGSFYLYQMEGIFQNDGDIFTHAYQGPNIRPGDVKFKDINGDGVIDEKDRSHVGSPIPKLTYGVTGNVQYKNFDLVVFVQGSQGNKIYYQVATDIEGFYRAFNVTQRVYDERWQGEGTSNTQPRVSWKGAANNKQPSTRFLEDGSYARLKNLQLGYTLPAALTKRWGMTNARVYIGGQNLLTFTRYPGMDPEMQSSDNLNNEQFRGDVAVGIDWGTYPSAKVYTLGMNLNF